LESNAHNCDNGATQHMSYAHGPHAIRPLLPLANPFILRCNNKKT
jgi:hypothetical protein